MKSCDAAFADSRPASGPANEGLSKWSASMAIAYHIVFGAYGFWLPNDPRGSWSDFVGAWELFRFGPATKVDTRASLANKPHDRDLRQSAKEALKYPPVQFSGVQARAIGEGFAESARRGGVIIWACAILPEHVHLVVARHRQSVETVINCFKAAATRSLNAQKL